MKPIKTFFKNYGLETLLVSGAFLLLFLLLWFRLGSLTYGNAAAVEVASQKAAMSWQVILNNPLNAPYHIVQKLVMMTGHDGITSMRLVSTLFGILAMVLFYMVARGWHSMRVAILATWLFISSAWFLHTARLATPEILWIVGILGLVVLFSPTITTTGHSWMQMEQPMHSPTWMGNSIIQRNGEPPKVASTPGWSGRVMSRACTGHTSMQTPQLMQFPWSIVIR